MLSEIIKEILEAETVAQQILSNAAAQASSIQKSTDAELLDRNKEFLASQKASIDKAVGIAKKNAEAISSDLLGNCKADIYALNKKVEANKQKAVDIILNRIMEGI